MPLINCKAELSLECVLTAAEVGADANATGAGSVLLK